ncbi:MAG: nuclear transport factor 2 family protein [Winogradskyella sp.]|nr:nuclear transport factor 2 family protein [Winogradskyella sp.]
MKKINLIFLIAMTTIGHSQELELTKLEIKDVALQEQNAFKQGNCGKVLELMTDDITFLANGKKIPSKSIIGKFCNSISRPFEKPTIEKLEIYPLTKETGYTIKTLQYISDDKTQMQEHVTKIWKKTNGNWKIHHLHSTIKQVPSSE